MFKYQDFARDTLLLATFNGIEWFSKRTISLRSHIYKILKPHTDKKIKKVRSDDIIMVFSLSLCSSQNTFHKQRSVRQMQYKMVLSLRP